MIFYLKFVTMIEKERKFLLKQLPKTEITEKIKQGYIMVQGNKYLRVRIVNDECSYLTLKIGKSSEERREYEYPIPLSDGLEIYNNTDIKLEKLRHKTTYMGNQVDVDIYPDGLQVVEIEYIDKLTQIPDFCGEEITGRFEYSNLYIALKNPATR